MMNEAQLHSENSFITLTYEDEPDELDHRDFQLFFKRLRKSVSPTPVRFFMCGEYGENLLRPHFHAAVFGYAFNPWTKWKKSGDNIIYRSSTLEKLWTHGFSTVAPLTVETAAYIARYVTKKITGHRSHEHYTDLETGLIRKPEYAAMSLKPGIGSAWLEKYKDDVYPHDYLVVNGKKTRPPRYYDKKYLETASLDEAIDLEQSRLEKAALHEANNTWQRLETRHQHAIHLNSKFNKRGLK